ncbi:MAG: hypothetical protein FIA99_08220 [Ruminiclostridium sp.]|nr:hypothetical protein [Ruminiclostridium sp.]
MSYERGWSALNLEMTDRIPKTEFVDHDEYIRKITGLDPRNPEQITGIGPSLANILDFDYIWSTYEMPIVKGRITSMGHAVWSDSTGNYQDNACCMFNDTEEVLDFDPVEEYGIPDKKDIVKSFKEYYEKGQNKDYPNSVFTGGRYNTIFSACIRTFGWEMFLSSVPYDYERFDRVLEGFYRITQAEVEAWIDVGIKVYNVHDDICWTAGPPFHPDWYRKYIFPRYKKMWAPLKDAGIKIIYTSDGTYTQFFDDIIAAGADGLVMEPTNPLQCFLEKYGKTKVAMGNIDCRILQFGSKKEIYQEVKRCADLGRNCPGYFFNVSNHIPNGIPIENIEYYFELIDKLGKR